MRTPFLISSDASASARLALPPIRLLPACQPDSAHSVFIIADSRDRAGRALDSAGKDRALAMTLDVEKYLHHLDGMDISDAEKAEFIRTLWLIAQCFVDDAYSGDATHDVSQLKSGFDAANVVDLSAIRQTRATEANDNAASHAKKEPSADRKKA